MIERTIKAAISERLFQGKAILLFGPRQAGKTTLCREIASLAGVPYLWLNADEPDIHLRLTHPTSTELKHIFGENRLIVIDEAQTVEGIGKTLKIAVDTLPEYQIIATGSSAFELNDKTAEPLTGRKFEFYLYPFSVGELHAHFGGMEEARLLEERLIFGMYPEVVIKSAAAEETLISLSESYLFKDIFKLESIKKPTTLVKLLQALALQMGQEVSYLEIGQTLGIDRGTVEKYIDVLEKAFIVFRLQALSRNARREIKRNRKIYFWDNGIRNAIIRNFNPLDLRQDKGALWENFLVAERIKRRLNERQAANYFFWRSQSGQEVDFIEEHGGVLHAFEFKWKTKKTAPPREFAGAYPNAVFKSINRENYLELLG